MFTKSATPATPVARPKSHINDSVTWVNDWYSPLEYMAGASPNLRLKGWFKKNVTNSSDDVTRPSVLDVFDLSNAQYLQEPVVVNEVVEEKPVDAAQNDDLKLALSIEKKDGQISSLSGLGI